MKTVEQHLSATGEGDSGEAVPAKRTAIVVLGMHRSGTSAFTRVFNLLGASLPKTLMPAAADNNPRGFWESEPIWHFNDALMEERGSRWDDWRPLDPEWQRSAAAGRLGERAAAILDDELATSALFVLKDPRICRLLPFWLSVLGQVGIAAKLIYPVRNPMEIAASLRVREGFPPAKSHLLWLTHLLSAESGSRGLPRAFASFADLLADWRKTIHAIEHAIDLTLPGWSAEAESSIDAFLSPGERHHQTSSGALAASPDVAPWVKTAYGALIRLCDEPHDSRALAELDLVGREFQRSCEAFAAAIQPEEALRKEIAGLQALMNLHERHVATLKARLLEKDEALQALRTMAEENAELRDQLEAAHLKQGSLQQRVELLLRKGAWRDGVIAERERQRDQVAFRLNSIQSGVGWQLADPIARLEARWPGGVRAMASAPKLLWWAASFQMPARLETRRQLRRILDSGLFDEGWYVRSYPQSLLSGLRPALDWLLHGWQAGRSPHPLFDSAWYTHEHPGVAASGINPLFHYLDEGAARGLDPHPLFSTAWYLEHRPAGTEAAVTPLQEFLRDPSAGLSPHPLFDPDWYRGQLSAPEPSGLSGAGLLVHYIEHPFGDASPHPLFDNAWYMERHLDGTVGATNPLVQFLLRGAAEGHDPHPAFDTGWYLKQYPDVAEAGGNPLLDFLMRGAWEGRDPNPFFDVDWYLHQHPDLIAARINPLVHYLERGVDGSIAPSPSFDASERVVAAPEDGTRRRTPLEAFLMRIPLEERGAPRSGFRTTGAPTPDPPREWGLFADTYQHYLKAAAREPEGESYIPDTLLEPAQASSIRAIAFYLPQFHPIPENDEWWGKGFTEWTNVSKAAPQFAGHYQPHLPGELGFYDLRVPEVQRRQAELARRYGLAGFCYHYYWFAGRRLLERPLEQMLADQSISLPFCICWANENWTRRWDGQEDDVLLAQEHTAQTDMAFIDDVIPLFKDRRYIRVGARPLLVVYRVDLLPEPGATADRWRERCREMGEPEPYLVAAQTFGTLDPRPFGFDAAVEFPPHNSVALDITDRVPRLNPDHRGRIYSYRSILERFVESEVKEYTRFRGIMPSWDNEARKPGQGNVYAGATPRLYGEWLQRICEQTSARDDPEERIIFINAWNEWAEGAHLEPDRRYGYAYLRVTAETLLRFPASGHAGRGPALRWTPHRPKVRGATIAVTAHVFDVQLWPEIKDALESIPEPYDLFVTAASGSVAEAVAHDAPAAAAQVCTALVQNRGRDMAPFVASLETLCTLGYELALKIHTKGTSTRSDGAEWRRDLFDKVLGTETTARAIIRAFRSRPELSLVAPTGHLLPIELYWGRAVETEYNLDHFEHVAQRIGLPRRTHGFSFPAGSVYWFRPAAFTALASLALGPEDFSIEAGHVDGTLAHALERLVGLLASTDGWEVLSSGEVNYSESPTPWLESGIYPYAMATRFGEIWDQPVEGLR